MPREIAASHLQQGGWVAIELTQEGDLRANDGTLERMLRRDLGLHKDHPVYIPVKRSALAEKQVVVSAMDGYVFVGAGLPPNRYFSLEKRSYVEQVLGRYAGTQRVPHIIRDADLAPLRGQINQVEKSPAIRRGAKVEVSEGMLAALQGVVIDVSDHCACVRFSTRTLVRILSLPLGMLQPVVEEPPKVVPVEPPKLYQMSLWRIDGRRERNKPCGVHQKRDRPHQRHPQSARKPSVRRIQLGFHF